MERRRRGEVAASILACVLVWAMSHSLALAESVAKVANGQTPPMGHGFAYLVGFVGGLAFFVASVITGHGDDASEGAA